MLLAPFPGETLFSWATRLHLRSGLKSAQHTLMHLFEGHTPRIGLHSLLPRLTPEIVTQVHGTYGLSEEQLYRRHTLRPLFEYFSCAGSSTMLLSRVSSGTLRACRACMSEDLAKYGVAYWHRDHQLRISVWCHRHQQPLREWSRPGATLAMELPGIDGYALEGSSPVTNESNGTLLSRLGHSINAGLEGALPPIAALQSRMLEGARAAGLFRGNTISRTKLSALINARLGPRLSALLHLTEGGEWRLRRPVESLLRGRGSPPSDPNIWLLLNATLEVASEPGRSPPPSAKATTALNKEAIQAALSRAENCLTAAARFLAVSRSKLITAMVHYDIAIPYVARVNSKFSGVEIGAILECVRSGTPHRQVASQFGCGVELIREVAVYAPEIRRDARRSRDHERRQTYRDIIQKEISGGISRTELRRRRGSELDWLHENDSAWLAGVLPAKKASPTPKTSRRDWQARDVALAERVQVAHKALSASERPMWKTRSLLLRNAGGLANFTNQMGTGRFPLTEVVLQQLAEPKSHFEWRRIEWALNEILMSVHPLTQIRLRLKSGLTVAVLCQHHHRIVMWAKQNGLPSSPRSVFAK